MKNHKISSEKQHNSFTPFILHLRIDSAETAKNILELLKPFVYLGGDVCVNKEQRQWAEDMCNELGKHFRL